MAFVSSRISLWLLNFPAYTAITAISAFTKTASGHAVRSKQYLSYGNGLTTISTPKIDRADAEPCAIA